MTTKTLKQQIIEHLQDGGEYTARQLADNMMMPDKKPRISQILSELKKQGIVTATQNHCPEEDTLRLFYQLKDCPPKTEKTPTKQQKEPPKMTKETQKPTKVTTLTPKTEAHTLYQVLISGIVEYETTDKDKAIEMGKQLAKSFIVDAQIIAVKPQIIGTIKVSIQTDFTAA